MSEDSLRAKKYLENKQLRVSYYKVSNPDILKGEDLLLQEEYPDFIPVKEEYVVLRDEEYIVYHRVYVPDENKLFVFLMKRKEYKNLLDLSLDVEAGRSPVFSG